MIDNKKQIDKDINVRSKMIEEMANIIFDGRYKNDYISPLRSANELYNAGYRKIPEGAVVLTREEYEKLRYLADECLNWRRKNCNINEICKEIKEGEV